MFAGGEGICRCDTAGVWCHAKSQSVPYMVMDLQAVSEAGEIFLGVAIKIMFKMSERTEMRCSIDF